MSPFERIVTELSEAYLSEVTIAIDFDGTCVKHEFPSIGEDVPGAVDVLRSLDAGGAQLILWTMRSNLQGNVISSPTGSTAGNYLQDACDWFAERGIGLHAANQNPQQLTWTDSPKAWAHIYIDDAALGCPLIHDKHLRPYVDWHAIAFMLADRFL